MDRIGSRQTAARPGESLEGRVRQSHGGSIQSQRRDRKRSPSDPAGSTPIRVVPRRLGGDPAPGEAKTLWVDYEVNGVRKQVELPENHAFDPYPAITAHPAYYLRREFDATGEIVKARLYASALGIYEFQINGKRVGNDMLAPGYTMYSKRVESLTYDVTDLVNDGDNAIGAVLGEGWYAGNLLLRKRTELLGLTPKLLAQLELTYADGRVETIVTDDQWRATDQGPIRAGGFYHGEDYDASKDLGDGRSLVSTTPIGSRSN